MIKRKKGMTLNEIMLAVVILAIAFIPIVGVISSSMKATEKDERIIKAMELCQGKLSIALQFPFDFFDPGDYNTNQTSNNTDHQLVLKLEPETIKSITYTPTLTVASETVNFTVPVVNFTKKPHDSCNNPQDWITVEPITVQDMVKRYTVTITWSEPGDDPIASPKFYTLSVLKANVQR